MGVGGSEERAFCAVRVTEPEEAPDASIAQAISDSIPAVPGAEGAELTGVGAAARGVPAHRAAGLRAPSSRARGRCSPQDALSAGFAGCAVSVRPCVSVSVSACVCVLSVCV